MVKCKKGFKLKDGKCKRVNPIFKRKKFHSLIVGLKIWVILLLAGLVLIPVTLLQIFLTTITPFLSIFIWFISILVSFFVWGWLFIKFKKWIFKR